MSFSLIGLINLIFLISRFVSAARPVIKTDSCSYEGGLESVESVTVFYWRGIRYAKPPIGELRFQPPQPFECESDESIPAYDWPNQCPQIGHPFIGPSHRANHKLNISEDCLQLNVWVPLIADPAQAAQALPYRVLIFIHGGSFVSLSSADDRIMDGKFLAARGGIIVVTFNYRLGVLGFTYTDHPDAPGNQGLLDQQLAIDWVRRNIHYFGGDPNSITLAGQGAGSVSASIHLLNVGRPGLYNTVNTISKYILQSGLAMPELCDDKATAFRLFVKLAELVGCRDDPYSIETSAIVACLRSRDVSTLLEAQTSAQYINTRTGYPKYISLPTADTRYFQSCYYNRSGSHGNLRGLSVLMVNMEDEGSTYVAFDPIPNSDDILTYLRFIENRTEMFLGEGSDSLGDIVPMYFSELMDGDETSLKEALIQMIGDRMIHCPSLLFAEDLADYNYVHRGIITYTVGNYERFGPHQVFKSDYGARHGLDVWFMFGAPFGDQFFADQDRWMSNELILLVSDFVKTDKILWPSLTILQNGLVVPFEYDLDIKKPYNPLRKSQNYFECKIWEPIIFPEEGIAIPEGSPDRILID